MTRVLDVSLRIGPDMVTWPGDPKVDIDPSARLARGDPANVSVLRLGSHTGTHVDPPYHFLDDGIAIDEVPLDVLYGRAVVAELPGHTGAILAEHLEKLELPETAARLLLKTENSARWRAERPVFRDDYAALVPDGAAWVIERGFRLIGIDFLSIERDGHPDYAVHRKLLASGVVILEGLDLSAVEPGAYTLSALPLKIADGDGGPARAALIGD